MFSAIAILSILFCPVQDFFLMFFLDIREHGEHWFYVFSVDLAIYIVFCTLHYQRRKHQHSDQVRDHHQSIEGIRDIPGQLRFHDRTGQHNDHKDNAVHGNGFGSEQVFACGCSVVAPSKNGGVGEKQNGKGNEPGTRFSKGLRERVAHQRTGTDLRGFCAHLSGSQIDGAGT